MAFASAAKHRMLDHLVGNTASGATIDRISLHTGDPGTTGANEVTGGSYAKVTIDATDFDAAGATTAGEIELNADQTFAGPASGTASHIGFWASSGTAFYAGGAITTGDTAFNAAGEFIVKAGTTLDLNA